MNILFQILNGFKEENFEVDVIGPDIYDENQKGVGEDIELARLFVESTNGATAPFADTMRYLLFHRKKITNPMPWNVDLSIGPNLKIPVSSYLRLKDEPIIKSWMKAIKDPVTSTASNSEAIIKNKIHISAENQTTVEPVNVIKGYHYGQRVIPFNECDKTMLYESGEKCLSVYGFTDAKNITWQNLNGEGLSYIFGRKGDKKAQGAIRCLVECLHELNLVGIVRRVYNKGNVPKMFALMPVIDANNYICLSMMGVCFKEEVKNMAFPPTNLKKYNCTDEQVNAFKDLIKAMDLTNAYDETYDELEAFPIAETVSPSAQYVLDCIAYRAKNPGKPLPQPRDDIMMLFKAPPLILKRSQDPLDKLKNLFKLNKIEVKTRNIKKNTSFNNNVSVKQDNDLSSTSDQPLNNFNVDMPKIQLPVKKTDEICRIGTVDPVSDFKALTTQGKTLADLSQDLSEAIENLVYCNLDGDYTKAFDTMKFYRTECITSDPSLYNNWFLKFKKALYDRKKHDILGFISEKNLGFILKEENSLSTYDSPMSHEDSQMYDNDTIPDSTLLTIQSDVNDLFDEI